MKSLLFWDVTQPRLVACNRCFGTTIGLIRWDPWVVPKRLYQTANEICVKSRKSEDTTGICLLLYYLLLILRHPMKRRDLYWRTRSSIPVRVTENNSLLNTEIFFWDRHNYMCHWYKCSVQFSLKISTNTGTYCDKIAHYNYRIPSTLSVLRYSNVSCNSTQAPYPNSFIYLRCCIV